MGGTTVSTVEALEVDRTGDELVRREYAWAPVSAAATALGALLVVTANGYGYHRDELYFRMLASHPAWGYVDQPPMTPMLVRASTGLFGDSLFALRVPAMICAVLTVFLVAALARELGGGRTAQTLAAIGVCPVFVLLAGHVLLTASPDMVFWVLTILFATRALLRSEPRWWIAAGVVTGAALYNKQLIVLLLISLAAGLAIAGPRRELRSPWLWSGAALALVIAAPTIIWQATHGWPEVRMAGVIATDKGPSDRVTFIPFQLLLVAGAPHWITGIRALFRAERFRPVRAIAWAYPAAAVIVLVTGGQLYYTFGLLAFAYAAGCVTAERRYAAGTARLRGTVGWMALAYAIALPIALPLVPLSHLGQTVVPALNQAARDQVGWPEYVREVADVYAAIPAGERAHTAVIAGNYGEAGAIARFGPADGLPTVVYSGQNQLWYYGPPPAADTTVLFVGIDPVYLASAYGDCAKAATLDNHAGVSNEEQGRPILVCRDPLAPWSVIWPARQHYS